MKMCHGCGIEKDITIFEIYVHEDSRLSNYPIPPLLEIDCQPDDEEDHQWRIPRVCHECFHKLDPDMWINKKGWESINPKVHFYELPLLSQGEP